MSLALALTLAGCASQKPAVGFGANADASRKTRVAAYSGWYLMQPPVRHGDPTPAVQLADWQVIEYFEHATECDGAREQSLSAYAAYVPVATTTSTDSVTMSQRLASSTVCVAANDPRINWFHIKWK